LKTLSTLLKKITMSKHDIKNNPDPKPFDYQTDIYQKGLKYERPPITFDPTKWESLAKERLSAESFGYVYGCAGTRQTGDNNLAAFKKWGLIPNRLVDSDFPDLSIKIFGQEYASPIAIAPVGVQRIFHRDGESATARAAAKEGVPYILSTASSTSIEDIAKFNADGDRWCKSDTLGVHLVDARYY
jgi:lactate 2-monooxygenase